MNTSIRDLNSGFATALSGAFEFALTTLLFVVGGIALDAWLGTRPLFTVALAVLAFVGQLLRSWYRYDAEMRRLEARLPSRGAGEVRPTVEEGV